jgi:DNA-binding IclR family transcriptional regulator
MADKERYIIAAVVKAGEVLKSIANAREPMTPTEIASDLDIDVNAAFRQCVTLESLGFLNQIGERYELGMGLQLFWARKKASLEAQRTRIEKELGLLGD